MLSRVVLSRVVSSRVVSSRVVLSRVVSSRVVSSRVVLSRVVLSRVVLSRVVSSRAVPSRVVLSRVVLSRPLSHLLYKQIGKATLSFTSDFLKIIEQMAISKKARSTYRLKKEIQSEGRGPLQTWQVVVLPRARA